MKSIIVYSGKGGVGKTTTAANLAKTLSEQGKRVFIVDGDINTPSMGVIFKEEHPSENIWLASTSFSSKNMIYLEKSMVRLFLRETIKKINEVKPDYIIIDTPPSITDVHINLIETFKVSAIVIVTQPSEISRLDVNRTARFFTDKYTNAGVVVVENMCQNETEFKYNWDVVAKIKFNPDFNGLQVFEDNKEKYNSIISSLENLKIEEVRLEAVKRELFDESFTIDDLPKTTKYKDLRFVNISTWEDIKERIQDADGFQILGKFSGDQGLESLTKENISRLVKAFEYDTEAYFMVTKAPQTNIKLIAGEIGIASMAIHKYHYGVPCILYKTKEGEVTLFPYECMPVSSEMLQQSLDDGYILTSGGRYLPKKQDCEEVYNAFGARVGMFEDWEKLYDSIVEGVSYKREVKILQENN